MENVWGIREDVNGAAPSPPVACTTNDANEACAKTISLARQLFPTPPDSA